MRPTICLLSGLLFLTGCATSEVKTATRTTRQGLGGAVTQPLADFNLLRTKIPPVLLRAQDGPYTVPTPVTCQYIHDEVTELDAALGPDMDVLDPKTSSRSDQGAAFLAKSAVSAVRDLTTDWIPFRSWVRTLTGAEQRSDAVKRSVSAGVARRAFLKGMAQSEDCPITAAPAPTVFPAPPQTPSSGDPAG